MDIAYGMVTWLYRSVCPAYTCIEQTKQLVILLPERESTRLSTIGTNLLSTNKTSNETNLLREYSYIFHTRIHTIILVGRNSLNSRLIFMENEWKLPTFLISACECNFEYAIRQFKCMRSQDEPRLQIESSMDF